MSTGKNCYFRDMGFTPSYPANTTADKEQGNFYLLQNI
jgi:hypothetical protein